MRIEEEIKDFAFKIGKKIRRLRKEQELTQKGLAEIMKKEIGHIDYTYIGRIERGEQLPSLKTLYRISKALQVRPWESLADEKDLVDKPYYQLSIKDREFVKALLDGLLSKKLSGEEKEILAKLVDRFSA